MKPSTVNAPIPINVIQNVRSNNVGHIWVTLKMLLPNICKKKSIEGYIITYITFPPVIPRPLLLRRNSCSVKQLGLCRKLTSPTTPLGPNALSLRSNSTSPAPALMMAFPRCSNALGISDFNRPVNMSLQWARWNVENKLYEYIMTLLLR